MQVRTVEKPATVTTTLAYCMYVGSIQYNMLMTDCVSECTAYGQLKVGVIEWQLL